MFNIITTTVSGESVDVKVKLCPLYILKNRNLYNTKLEYYR